MSGINEAYINSLPSLHGTPKVSIDLNCFQEFTAKSEGLRLGITNEDIRVRGKAPFPEKVRFHVNSVASIVVLIEDEDGFPVREYALKTTNYKKITGCGDVRRLIIAKGNKVPLSVPLKYDAELGGWVARLPKIENNEKRCTY